MFFYQYYWTARSYTYGRQTGEEDEGFGYYQGYSGGADENNAVEDNGDGAYGEYILLLLMIL